MPSANDWIAAELDNLKNQGWLNSPRVIEIFEKVGKNTGIIK